MHITIYSRPYSEYHGISQSTARRQLNRLADETSKAVKRFSRWMPDAKGVPRETVYYVVNVDELQEAIGNRIPCWTRLGQLQDELLEYIEEERLA